MDAINWQHFYSIVELCVLYFQKREDDRNWIDSKIRKEKALYLVIKPIVDKVASQDGESQYHASVLKNFRHANHRDYLLFLLDFVNSCSNFAASDSCELFLYIGE